MARTVRNDQLDMNFDGLTDAVTNLVGNLILIVILMFGITSEVTLTEPPQAVAAPGPRQLPPPNATGTKQVGDLLLELETLQAVIAQVDRELAELEDRVPELQSRAEAVIRKAAKPK